jgi:hypothetical protein
MRKDVRRLGKKKYKAILITMTLKWIISGLVKNIKN